MLEPLISVVIPAYNRRDSVLQLLADLYLQQTIMFEVIVVDDCSPDDTVSAIREQYPQTIILRNEHNSGPAVARNRGVSAAKGEFIVGFDSDVTLPDTKLLCKVFDTFSRHPDATGLAFRLLGPDGITEDAPRWWHPIPLAQGANKFFETHYFSGTGYAFRKKAMMAAGIFPAWLYMHYEEVVLAYRILDAGGHIYHCPDLRVLHHASPVAERSRIKMYYKPRNQILVAIACFPWLRAFTFLMPRMLYNAIASIRGRYFGEYSDALRSAWQIGRTLGGERQPLKSTTWQRISSMRLQKLSKGSPASPFV